MKKTASACCCIPSCSLRLGVFIIGCVLSILSAASLLIVICELAGAFVLFGTVTSAGVLYVLVSNVPTLVCGILCLMATFGDIHKEKIKHLWLLEGAVTSFWVQFIISIVAFVVMMIMAIVHVDEIVESMTHEFVTSGEQDQTLTPRLARNILIADLVIGVVLGVAVQLYMVWIIWSYKLQVKDYNNEQEGPLLTEEENKGHDNQPVVVAATEDGNTANQG
eukprot:TRINITY_DN600_c0_g1_i1.p2 TRINITY_DN600_c0_g1~~TRINITY_DN600_c0_g1_i1.p2  ORF type:complete len:221 (+),score=19.23 TRINITY_DN600_c0_g1_i1:250-912(+)